ncbi:MAG: ribosomal protein S18-alanine N-acetyltransferase [Proteobacteria bacterium]|nr:ribosomal protein S18-alanine N-acetyltransferase [Pseudomonadota bacterium]MBU4296263.1 ribosomal protein S18-alanine N-acetyltransferase [Pseudomonadota bacterium]MCG2746379.1 ribosomal protein S18-alanine N-acetyltransferase [Desulfobulbaceae bacterium]
MTEADLVDLVLAEEEKPAWTAAQFAEELYHPYAWQFVACHGETSRFAGYICCRSVVGEGEILKFSVIRDFRGQGVGRLLLQSALQRMAEEGASRCYLEVRDSNDIARDLYEKFGFRQIGYRRDYYSSPREAAVVYKLNIAKGGKAK